MAVTIKITSAGTNISSILEIWTGTTLTGTSYYISVSKTDLLSGYTFIPPIGAMAFQVKSTGTCTTVVDLQCSCDPQYTWIPVGDGTYYRTITHPVTSPTSPYTLIKADGFSTYSAGGTRVYNSGFATDGSSAPASTLTTNILWKNTAANTTDGPLNRSGIWTNVSGGTSPATKIMYPLDTWIGFNTCLTGLVSGKTYYIGIAGDNDYKLTLDGNIILDTKLTSLTNGSFFYWHIYPVTISGGTSILGLFGLNRTMPNLPNLAAFGCEIYDNTLSEIISATNIGDLNILFKSVDLSSHPIATIVQYQDGTYLSNGYRCLSGGTYSDCSGTCVEKIPCPG